MKQTNIFFQKWNQFKKTFFSKNFIFNNYFLESACSFYFGLIIGNLFGTFLNFLRNKIVWDGMLLLIIVLFFEFFNFLIYKKSVVSQYKKLFLLLKNFQIGILFGFFIDAFKVGS